MRLRLLLTDVGIVCYATDGSNLGAHAVEG
jgi:hypothetical protein